MIKKTGRGSINYNNTLRDGMKLFKNFLMYLWNRDYGVSRMDVVLLVVLLAVTLAYTAEGVLFAARN